jgi:formylglycine-generating enzyme required for sulfatase activity
MVTEVQAEEACTQLGSGWDLCSADQWQHACSLASGSATSYPYGDTYAGGTCNGHDYEPTGDWVIGGGAAGSCTSMWNTDEPVFDLSGNVEEWTSSWIIVDTDEPPLYQILGGSYNDLDEGLTCDFTFWKAQDDFYMANLGFRCCRGDDPL